MNKSPIRAILGHSDDVDSDDAARAVIEQCVGQLDGATPKAALLFMAADYDADVVLRHIQERWPGLPIIGSSTAGEVSSQLGYREESVCLTLLAGEGFEACVGRGLDTRDDLDGAVKQAVSALGDAVPKLAIMICSPFCANAEAIARTLHRELGERACPIVGGLSGDHQMTESTRQFCGEWSDFDSVSVIFLTGDLVASWGVASGWFPIGNRHTVTRSEGNKIFEIDGRPALEIYQSFWGDRVSGNLGEFPLAVCVDGPDDDYFLRAAMSLDELEGSVSFAGDVPQGSTVRLTEVLPEGLLSGTEQSVRNAAARFDGEEPSLALLFSCAARKWVLGTRAEEEIEHLMRSFDDSRLPALSVSGFYAFGEICPLDEDGPPMLHNETCVTVLLGS